MPAPPDARRPAGKVFRGGAEPLTACQLSTHLANEGSESCSDQTEKGEKEKRAALKLYVQSAGQLSAYFIESIGKVY